MTPESACLVLESKICFPFSFSFSFSFVLHILFLYFKMTWLLFSAALSKFYVSFYKFFEMGLLQKRFSENSFNSGLPYPFSFSFGCLLAEPQQPDSYTNKIDL